MNKLLLLLMVMTGSAVCSAEDFRDPTVPLGQVTVETSDVEYNLQYIINRDGHYIAAINGEIVKVGDVFRNMRVSKIDNASVELVAGNDQTTILQLIENVNKNYEQK